MEQLQEIASAALATDRRLLQQNRHETDVLAVCLLNGKFMSTQDDGCGSVWAGATAAVDVGGEAADCRGEPGAGGKSLRLRAGTMFIATCFICGGNRRGPELCGAKLLRGLRPAAQCPLRPSR